MQEVSFKNRFYKKELNIYTKINRYINEFIEANLVIEIGNKQKHLFGATTRSFFYQKKVLHLLMVLI